MKVSAHLTFNGQCEAAFRFYEQCLGGAIVTMITYGDSPLAEQVPLAWRKKIVHATLTIGENVLAGADLLPDDYQSPQGFFVLIEIEEAAEAEHIFRQLSEGGSVRMPMQETFWARRFGVVTDPFGTPWEISCGRG